MPLLKFNATDRTLASNFNSYKLPVKHPFHFLQTMRR